MPYLVRSMSTTDYMPAYRRGNDVIPAQKPQPYHIFLKKAGSRFGAYWASYHDINVARFETAEEAEAEAKRAGVTNYDVVPHDFASRGLPNFWDARS